MPVQSHLLKFKERMHCYPDHALSGDLSWADRATDRGYRNCVAMQVADYLADQHQMSMRMQHQQGLTCTPAGQSSLQQTAVAPSQAAQAAQGFASGMVQEILLICLSQSTPGHCPD